MGEFVKNCILISLFSTMIGAVFLTKNYNIVHILQNKI